MFSRKSVGEEVTVPFSRDQANVQVGPNFETLSSLMTFHLLKGIAWTEAVPIAKPLSDKLGLATPKDSRWRGHAKWLVKKERRHNFDLTFVEDDERGQVVH